jgi:hypothetical protein
MSEQFTMIDAAPEVNEAGLNAAEQESLAVAESLESGDSPLLAGKFKDASSLEQAYLELQKKLGEPKEDVRDEEGEQAEAPEEVEETSDEETETEAEGLTEAQAQQLFQMVGGEKAYQSMIKWAGQNLSQEEVSMYDSVMGKGDPNAIFFAVQALNSKYSDSVGRDGQMLSGKSAQSEDNSFQSQQELVQAMSDPRYDNDPAYRRSVLNKLANSDVEF